MSSSIQYEQLSTNDADEDHLLDDKDNETIGRLTSMADSRQADIVDNNVSRTDEEEAKDVVLGNDKPYPISRPPPKSRDFSYAAVFMLHFVAVLLLSVIEQSSLQHSLINYGRAGSWASMLMIVTLLGSFFGAVTSMMIGSFADYREYTLGLSINFALFLKIAVGNVLLIMRSSYSIFGFFILLWALIDYFVRMKSAKENLLVTSALIQMTLDSTRAYNLGFFITCSVIVFAQTCILLWWGAFFIGMLSTVAPAYAELCAFFMLMSLIWITSFFQSMMAFVVGGCILWLFVKEEHEPIKASKKLFLYLQCAVTTSLGSLCKGALYVPTCQCVLTLHHWNSDKRLHAVTGCTSTAANFFLCLTKPFLNWSQKNHRLTYALIATYGKTFSKTAEDHCADYPETLDICVEDSTQYTLDCVAVVLSSLVSIIFSLFAEKREGTSWPLFFFICFYLSYCGLTLSIHIYSAAVDALIVASALNPIRFAKGNQIIFLRFLRTSEAQLR